ncbi:18357_t:CDS:1, partial [Racocetra persica]
KNPNYVFGKSNTVFSYHFSYSEKEMLVYCKYMPSSNVSKLSTLSFCDDIYIDINCVRVEFEFENPYRYHNNYGQIVQKWSKKKLKQKQNIFTGNKWKLPEDENFIFASLLDLNYATNYKPSFININPKYPIIKSLEDGPKYFVDYVIMSNI